MGFWRVKLGLMAGFVWSCSCWKELGETISRGPLRGVLGRVGFLVVGFFAGIAGLVGVWLAKVDFVWDESWYLRRRGWEQIGRQ